MGLLAHVPNAITVSRILLIPVFVVCFWDPTPERSLVAAAVFGLAALTDAIDGYMARRLGHITQLGKILDPIADKLLVLTALVLLVDFGRVAAWIAILLASREFIITGLRVVAAREHIDLTPETTGKIKMAAQVVAVLFLILDESVSASWHFHNVGTSVLLISLALSLISAAQYIQQFARQMFPRGGTGRGEL